MPHSNEITSLALSKLQSLLTSRDLDSETLVKAFLDRIDAFNPEIGAYLTVDAEGAIAAARESDRQRRAGRNLGPLMGIPVAVKDLLVVDGMATKAGTFSDMSALIGPEGSFVGSLRALGCIILGKTRSTEFAFSPSGLNEAIGVPRNPSILDAPHLTGGSSSGSAAAVAARLAPLAIGSDTGGSVRVPAALCGVAGLKTSPGLWATDGVFQLSSTLDTLGLLAGSVDDLTYSFNAIQGLKGKSSVKRPARLGIGAAYFLEGLDADVAKAFDAACRTLRRNGVDLVELDMPEAAERAPALVQIMAFELAESMGRDYLRSEHRYSDPYVEARVRANLDISRERYDEISRRHKALVKIIGQKTADLPFWITPTVPISAPPAPEVRDMEAEMRLNLRLTQNTQPLNLFGLCAVSIPLPNCVKPVGLQLAGPANREADLLSVAGFIENLLYPIPVYIRRQ